MPIFDADYLMENTTEQEKANIILKLLDENASLKVKTETHEHLIDFWVKQVNAREC